MDFHTAHDALKYVKARLRRLKLSESAPDSPHRLEFYEQLEASTLICHLEAILAREQRFMERAEASYAKHGVRFGLSVSSEPQEISVSRVDLGLSRKEPRNESDPWYVRRIGVDIFALTGPSDYCVKRDRRELRGFVRDLILSRAIDEGTLRSKAISEFALSPNREGEVVFRSAKLIGGIIPKVGNELPPAMVRRLLSRGGCAVYGDRDLSSHDIGEVVLQRAPGDDNVGEPPLTARRTFFDARGEYPEFEKVEAAMHWVRATLGRLPVAADRHSSERAQVYHSGLSESELTRRVAEGLEREARIYRLIERESEDLQPFLGYCAGRDEDGASVATLVLYDKRLPMYRDLELWWSFQKTSGNRYSLTCPSEYAVNRWHRELRNNVDDLWLNINVLPIIRRVAESS